MRVLAVSALLWSLIPHSGVDARSGDLCHVAVDRREYVVRGATAQEVQLSMLSNGPKDAAGVARFAVTEWTVEWSWSQPVDGSIDADSITLSCSATMLLPRYEPTGGDAPELSPAWRNFAKRLEKHELNHLEHVRRIAPEIRERIKRAARKNDGVSPAQANRIAHRVIREMRALDTAYDEHTDHGKTEGVWSL